MAQNGETGHKELSKQELLGDDQVTEIQFSEHYIFGKAKTFKFATGIHKTKGMLNYIHNDLLRASRMSSVEQGTFCHLSMTKFKHHKELLLLMEDKK